MTLEEEFGERLWVEDECLLHDPYAEHVAQAYFRLTGQDFLADKEGTTAEDRGDYFVRRMPNGLVVITSYDGSQIHRGTWDGQRKQNLESEMTKD